MPDTQNVNLRLGFGVKTPVGLVTCFEEEASGLCVRIVITKNSGTGTILCTNLKY